MLNYNVLESIIKVNLWYFELRKIIFKVEFLLIIPLKVEFLLQKVESLLKSRIHRYAKGILAQ